MGGHLVFPLFLLVVGVKSQVDLKVGNPFPGTAKLQKRCDKNIGAFCQCYRGLSVAAPQSTCPGVKQAFNIQNLWSRPYQVGCATNFCVQESDAIECAGARKKWVAWNKKIKDLAQGNFATLYYWCLWKNECFFASNLKVDGSTTKLAPLSEREGACREQGHMCEWKNNECLTKALETAAPTMPPTNKGETYAPTTPPTEKSGGSAGAVVGALTGIVVIAGGAFAIYRARQKNELSIPGFRTTSERLPYPGNDGEPVVAPPGVQLAVAPASPVLSAPPGVSEWSEHKDPSRGGRKYWHNTKTGETTWKNPCAGIAKPNV